MNGERRGHFWTTIDRILLICALLGAAFSAGYNYRGLDAMAKSVEVLTKTQTEGFAEIKANYVRQDVTDANQRRIDEQLAQIRAQLDRIEARGK